MQRKLTTGSLTATKKRLLEKVSDAEWFNSEYNCFASEAFMVKWLNTKGWHEKNKGAGELLATRISFTTKELIQQ